MCKERRDVDAIKDKCIMIMVPKLRIIHTHLFPAYKDHCLLSNKDGDFSIAEVAIKTQKKGKSFAGTL
ncbi:hypothetical protein A3F06_02540 [candidate division TM6 bacterium RIFCSPHIGHO2_12_FULL_36_22]|nr:MAG: hypothetical protein A3F06_02540 [candidate division TM6 bacterium RIFCSPHIGHO2_12_FULL_36_22]